MYVISLPLHDHGLDEALTVHGTAAWVPGSTKIRYTFNDPAVDFPGTDCPVMGALVIDRYLDPVHLDDPSEYDFDDAPSVTVSLGDPAASDAHDQLLEVGDWGLAGSVVCGDLYMNPGPNPYDPDRYPFGADNDIDTPTHFVAASLLRAAAWDYVKRYRAA